MWVVRPIHDDMTQAIVAWLRGSEGIWVYGTAEAAQTAADRLNKNPLHTSGPVWTVAELPPLLVAVVDELRERLRLVEGTVARMREAGAVALWTAAPEQPEGSSPAQAEKKTTLN